ncbi:MAG: tyrosine-type recombinase/integrase [Candidatus Anammoxibacter sp.]
MFKRGVIWWTCIRHKGRKIQKSLETGDRKLAQKIEAKVRTELVEGTYFNKPISNKKTVKDMLDRFIKEHAYKQAINTQKSYNTSYKHLTAFFGNALLSAVDRKMIAKYKSTRRVEKTKPSSLNREMSMLSKAFNLATTEWEWIENYPKISKEKENNETDRFLFDDEEKRLLLCSAEWLKDLITFALHSGLRQDEQLSLAWTRVNMERRTILIQETKSGKPRSVPLNQTALNVLLRKLEIRSIKNDLVFFSTNGTKINNCNLIRAFNKVMKKAKIDDFTWHGLRRSFATRLVQKGIDIYQVAELLGHSDVKMTQKRYAHHCPESLRSGVEILDVDYNLTTIGQNKAISAVSN